MLERVDKSSFEIADAAMSFIASRDTPICVTCHKSYVVFVNQAFCDIFGYEDFHDLLGCHLSILIADEQPHPHFDEMGKYFSPQGKTYHHNGLVKGRKKDGSVFDVYIHGRDGFHADKNLFMSCSANLPGECQGCIS